MDILVRYSCRACDVQDVKLQVPMRESPEVPVVKWMEVTIQQVANHHRTQFPWCRAKSLQDLKIPIENAEWIGGPPLT